jgi:hypothetical protein
VLIALVEADDTSFPLDAPKILELRQAGLSERVITAMLKSGRTGPRRTPPFPAAQAACPGCDASGQPAASAEEPPSLVIIGGEKEEPEPAPVPQQVIVMPWIAVGATPGHHRPHPRVSTRTTYRGFGRFINDGWVDGTTTIR